MSTKKPAPRNQAPTAPSITQSQFELAKSQPAVSLDPRDYVYPSSIHGPSIWSIRMEQALVKSASMKALPSSTSLLSDEFSAGDTQTLEQLGSGELADPSSTLECFAFESLPENSEKSSNTRNSPRRTTATSKTGLRSSGPVKIASDDEEGPEMLMTSSSSLLGLIDSEMLGSNAHVSNIVNLGQRLKRGRKLSLNLDHEITAACINRVLDVGDEPDLEAVLTPAAAPPAKKAAAEPSNSCESSQSPCNVAGLQAC